MSVKLGLPSKGRLMEQTLRLVRRPRRDPAPHRVRPRICRRGRRPPGVELVLLSAGEIPRELAAGRLHLGVTGIGHGARAAAALGSAGRANWRAWASASADLVIAVPRAWVDVDTLDDLDAAAAAFRAAPWPPAADRHQVPPAGARVPDGRTGVADYQLVDSQGATEGTVKNLTAEAIADITTTGATLRGEPPEDRSPTG